MPLSSIVVIVIRLFALNWVLTAIPMLLSAVATPQPHDGSGDGLSTLYALPVLLLIFAAVLWIFARATARLVSRGVDSTLNIGTLSRADLYSFAFVFLGLFFILSSFADVINWIHYFTVSREDPTHDPHIKNFYQLTRPFVTLALGVVSLVGARRWTKMLISREQKDQVA